VHQATNVLLRGIAAGANVDHPIYPKRLICWGNGIQNHSRRRAGGEQQRTFRRRAMCSCTWNGNISGFAKKRIESGRQKKEVWNIEDVGLETKFPEKRIAPLPTSANGQTCCRPSCVGRQYLTYLRNPRFLNEDEMFSSIPPV
jgi:hypothetical protein